MPFPFDKYPWLNFQELNLAYFIKHFREIFEQWNTLLNEMYSWKDATDAELAEWKSTVETGISSWETGLQQSMEDWKDETEADITTWEAATLSALDAWKDATTAVFEQIRTEAAASAQAAAGSATAAQTALTGAQAAQTAAETAAAGIQSELAQIQTNTADISELQRQLSDTETAVETLTEIKHTISLDLNGYIRCNYAAGTQVYLNPTLDAGFKSAVIDCSPGDIFELDIQGASAARPWAFVDSDRYLISKSETLDYTYNGRIVAPENAAKLILNQKLELGTAEAYKITGDNAFDEMEDTVSQLSSIIINEYTSRGFEVTSRQYATNNNGVIAYEVLSTYSTFKHAVNGETRFRVSGKMRGSSTALCYVCDANNNILRTIGQGTTTEVTYTNEIIDINDAGAAYVVFTFISSSNPTAEIYEKGSVIDILRPLQGKKINVWGDSRTWYDGKEYQEGTLDEGATCIGFLTWLRYYLNATVYNKGYNGYTSPQIYTVITQTAQTGIDAIVLFTGINDWYKNVTIGSIDDIGSAFDTTTAYGACQAMVEHILNNYPGTKLYILNPFNGWRSGGIGAYTDTDYPKVWKDIATLYSLPFLDLTYESGLNILNYSRYFVDNPSTFILHLNNDGNALIGKEIAEFMISH